jgi:Flp pilus assembly protein TadG
MRNRPSTRKSSAKRVRCGVAAVELAVVAPLFLLLLGGIIEFGEAFRVEHMLANATRRGARSAIVDGTATSQVLQQVKTHCVQTLGVYEADVTVQLAINGITGVDLSQAAEGDEISVTVRVPFSKVGAGFYAKMFSTSILSSTCTLEHE